METYPPKNFYVVLIVILFIIATHTNQK
jgi:hypothetical protein